MTFKEYLESLEYFKKMSKVKRVRTLFLLILLIPTFNFLSKSGDNISDGLFSTYRTVTVDKLNINSNFRIADSSNTIKRTASTDSKKPFRNAQVGMAGGSLKDKETTDALFQKYFNSSALNGIFDTTPRNQKELKTSCLPITNADGVIGAELMEGCRVVEFGHLATYGQHNYYSALYSYPNIGRGDSANIVVAFEGGIRGDSISPIIADLEPNGITGGFLEPRLGFLKSMPILITEYLAGGNNGSIFQKFYIINKNKKWKVVDSDSWRQDIEKRIPKNTEFRSVLYINPKNFTVESSLWKADDSNACASGGSVRAELVFSKNSFVIKEFHFDSNPVCESN